MDPNKTQMVPQGDPNKTQMIGMDANRTQMIPSVSGPAIEVAVISGRDCALANAPSREQFLIEMKAGAAGFVGGRTPLNLCLTIDRSGSMEGEPLDYVKRACEYVVDLLAPDDVLSIVTFEETVEVLMPPRQVLNKDLIKQHISRITAGNTTNLYDGMAMAAQQLMASPEAGRITRMIVLSDGDPTTGIKDFPSLMQHVEEIKKRGITATFLGFGYDYNEELLAGMAKRSGGNYYFIQRPDLIPEVFRTELDKLFTMAGRNVRLSIKPSRWVQLRQIYGHTIAFGQPLQELNLADIEKGSSLEVAVDFDFQNHPLGHYRVATGQLIWDDSATGKTERTELDFLMEFTADQKRTSVSQNPRVAKSVEISLASRVVEKTMMGLKSGELTAAMAISDLQKTQMLLAQDGRVQEAEQVGQAVKDLQAGRTGQVEKTLIGTMISLDQGKKQN